MVLSQTHIERVLVDWLDDRGVPVPRGRTVTELRQDDGGVDLELEDSSSMRAAYVVSTDGGRSVVRRDHQLPDRGGLHDLISP